jgi:hypothetical protein
MLGRDSPAKRGAILDGEVFERHHSIPAASGVANERTEHQAEFNYLHDRTGDLGTRRTEPASTKSAMCTSVFSDRTRAHSARRREHASDVTAG